jgi:hypothetical protein
MERIGDEAPAKVWAPDSPDEKAPWPLRRVVHLDCWSRFASWPALQRDLADGTTASIDRRLQGQCYGEITEKTPAGRTLL